MMESKRILLLAANPLAPDPQKTVYLRLQEEEREIKERLRLAGYGKTPVNSAVAIRPRDIQQAMVDFNPQIVHFSGHGSGQHGLLFEDVNGQEKLVSSEALAKLFRLFADYVECVVLNACYSEVQAKAINQHIKYVIGMSQSISDRSAIEFAVGFYTALGAGRAYEFAYELGCNAIQLAGVSENLTPVLLTKKQQLMERPKSEKSIEYTKLQNLLKTQRWQEADEENKFILFQMANQIGDDFLNEEIIQSFDCDDLHIIDQLWIKHSNGRFGFSVQKRIWQEVEEDYHAFGREVGWWEKDTWKGYSDLTFDISAPVGHLPIRWARTFGVTTTWACARLRLPLLVLRFETCGI